MRIRSSKYLFVISSIFFTVFLVANPLRAQTCGDFFSKAQSTQGEELNNAQLKNEEIKKIEENRTEGNRSTPFDFSELQKNPVTKTWKYEKGHYPEFENISVNDILSAVRLEVESGRQIIRNVKNEDTPTFENTIIPLTNDSSQADAILSMYYSSFSTPQFKSIVKEAVALQTEFGIEYSSDKELYRRVKIIYDGRDQLDPDQKRLVEKTYRGFINGGIGLEGASRARFEEIQKKLSDLDVEFQQNVTKSEETSFIHLKTKTDLLGLEESIAKFESNAKEKGLEGYVIPLTGSNMVSVLEKAENRELRKEMYALWRTRAYKGEYDNSEVLKEIASLKNEMVQILGFENYAQYSLNDKMAGTLNRLQSFMDQLLLAYKPAAERDEAELQAFAKEQGFNEPLKSWDRSYFSKKLMENRYSYDAEKVKEYLPLEGAQKALFEIARKLYGLSFHERSDLPKPHPDDHVYEVRNQNGEIYAYLIADFYERPGTKSSGAWMSGLLRTHLENGKRIPPLVSINLNLSKPVEGRPTLLTVDEGVTLFHEFGHALHGMLSTARYTSQAGTGVVRDFVELPSQFMENFFFEPEVLKMFAYHYKTKEPLPQELQKAIQDSNQFRSGTSGMGQLRYVQIDMAWHTGRALKIPGSIFEVESEISKDFVIKGIEADGIETATSASFSHIFSGGYSAAYYSYKWAEVLDADAFSIFKKEGLFNPKTAERFRKYILEVGDSIDAMEAYINFAGREPSIEPMLKRDGLID